MMGKHWSSNGRNRRRTKRGGGMMVGMSRARNRAYNFARWWGNVEPWISLSPSKIVRRYARRMIGRTLGRGFSWSRLFGL